MIDSVRLGRRIRYFREKINLTQEKLAYECGYSKSYVCKIESGKKIPSLLVIDQLSNRLGISAYDVLVFPENGDREKLTYLSRRLNAKSLKNLLSLVQTCEEMTDL